MEVLDVDALSIVPDAQQNLISAEVALKIDQAINSLPPRCQLIFRFKPDRLKYKEVAALLVVSPKTVDAQLTIAVKKITQAIKLDLSADQIKSGSV